MKSYGYLQTFGKQYSYYTTALLNRFSDAFYRLVVRVFILEIFFMSVFTNLSLFQVVHLQIFYDETVMNNRIASQIPTIFFKKKGLISNISEVTDICIKSSQVQLLKKKIEQILSTIMIMNMRLLGQYQCTLCGVISCHSLVTQPVCAWIHSFQELDKSTPGILRTSSCTLLSTNHSYTYVGINQVCCCREVDELIQLKKKQDKLNCAASQLNLLNC